MAKLVERVLARFGYQPAAAPVKRMFTGNAAAFGGMVESWGADYKPLNASIGTHLSTMRTRSRVAAQDNPYAAGFLSQARVNVLGPVGITCQVQAKRADGTIDEKDSSRIEKEWQRWGEKINCDISARYCLRDAVKLALNHVVTDGEMFIRLLPRMGAYRFQIQLIDPVAVPVELIKDLPNGNKIRLGVEVNAYNKPVAYYVSRQNIADPQVYHDEQRYERVPAEEMLHLFAPSQIGQYRGIPLFASAAKRLYSLDKYEEAAVVAARVGAAKMGWWATPDGNASALAELQTDGTYSTDAEPGHFDVAPPGATLNSWDPQYPHEQYPYFVKNVLRSIACGWGISYTNLSNDLESVNFSSARVGMATERDVWMALQEWLIEEMLKPLFSMWLQNTLSFTQYLAPLPVAKFDKFNAPVFQGRRWGFLDPLKDAQANIEMIRANLKSRAEFIRERGADPEEVWAEIEKEKLRFPDEMQASDAADTQGNENEAQATVS